MKAIILSILFLLLLASACDEEIVYRDRIVYDSIPFFVNTFKGYDLDSTRSFKVIGADTVVVIRVDTVEREAKLVYDPLLQNYIDSFFVYAQQKIPDKSRLAVDVVMEVADLGIYVSSTEIVDGYYLIKINISNNCYEAGVYRELLHTLYNRAYIYEWSQPMIPNWEGCLENWGYTQRINLIDNMFDEG